MNASVSTVAVARPTFLRKITPKTVTAEVGIDLLSLNRPVQARELYKLYCRIQRTKMTTTTLGESMGFLGDFRAVTPEGKRFMSGKAYIPVMDSILYSSLADAQDPETGDPKAVLQVAISIGIKPAPVGKPSMTGYEFDVQIISQPSEDDPLERLERETTQAQQLALGSPEASKEAANGNAATGESVTAPPVSDAAQTREGHAKGHKGGHAGK
jgi:hypothetical protein